MRVVEARFSQDRNGEAVTAVYRRLTGTSDAGGERRADLGGLTRAVTRGALAYGRHKLGHVVERRRMNRFRENPVVLTTALASAKKVLIVCHGNIIRSAFAARLVAQGLGEGSRVSISSAGLAAIPGRPPHPTAVMTARALDVDLGQHTAARLEREHVAAADVILVMDLAQLAVVRARFPEARGKTFLLTSLAPSTPLEVRDPINGDESWFQACFDHITRAVGPIVHTLSSRPS
jgi:protein-tyrosine-phosphatase